MRVHLSTETDDPEILQQLLDWSFDLNLLYLLKHPHTPPLYASGVRYRREPRAVLPFEQFATIPDVLRQGWGDCDDLAPWRAAELNLRGIGARPVILDASHPRYRDVAGPGRLWHVVVARELPGEAEPVIEDPSARLGMYGV